MRQTNQAGLDLIKSFEGLRLTTYKDSVGILTIGYGHTGSDVTPNLGITAQQAEDLLKKDLNMTETGVSKAVTVQINDNQFAALVAFAFNVGVGNLRSSTLLRLLNSGDYTGAAQQFLVWNKAGGKVVDGLSRRRAVEKALFES